MNNQKANTYRVNILINPFRNQNKLTYPAGLILLMLCCLGMVATTSWAKEQKNFAIAPGASCTSGGCHAERVETSSLHEAAVDGYQCLDCHEYRIEGEHGFKPYDPQQPLCFNCHDEDEFEAAKPHDPVMQGDCLTCHDPHGSEHNALLTAEPPELCSGCHDSELFEGSTQHDPATQGACLKCHSPHGSENDALLNAPQAELCFTCHQHELRDARGKIIPSTQKIFEDKKAYLHKPFREGRCTTCHAPHSADNYRLFKENYPEQLYASYNEHTYESCHSCHKNLDRKLASAKTSTQTAFRNGEINLHYIHVNRTKGRTCRTCHQHHGSKNPKLVREFLVFGERTLDMEYTKTQTGGTCAPACHVTVSYDRIRPVRNDIIATTQKPNKPNS